MLFQSRPTSLTASALWLLVLTAWKSFQLFGILTDQSASFDSGYHSNKQYLFLRNFTKSKVGQSAQALFVKKINKKRKKIK